MNRSFYVKINRLWCAVVCLVLLGSTLCLCSSAASVKNYRVTMDYPCNVTADNIPIVIRGYEHGTDPELTIAGWIKTDQNIKVYEYTMDGGKTWKRSSKAVQSRPDVKSYCPNTYQTAGFHLNIDVSDLKRGTYDLFVRAYTANDDVIDVLAMLNIAIGHTDTLTMAYHELNLLAFGEQDGTLTLQAGQQLELDTYNLRNYQSFEIISDTGTTLTLKSDSAALSFKATSTESLQNEDGTFTTTVSLSDAQFAGMLILKSTQTVQVYRIRFYTTVPDYYKGDLTVYMTATPDEYLSGANSVDYSIMADETVGTYTRLFPINNTNDPYIYFQLGKYLKETQEKQITADHYRYAVITLQMPSTNSAGLFRLFLCAGEIHGPSGDSHVAFQPTNDGQWHRYVIPLCEEEHWTGTVYGMRFDFIDSHAKSSDYANIASISFHPDEKSAKTAAAQPFEVYHEQDQAPTDIYKEEGRAPSGRADAITWFDQSLADCFSGENKSVYSFDEYGHLIMQATETTNDPYVSFSLQTYSEKTGLPMLRAEDYGIIVLRILADKKIDGKGFTLYYYSGGLNFAQGERSVSALYGGDKWEYLIYNMSDKNAWTDQILGMRLDYASQISAGQRVCLSDILFFKDMEAWAAYAEENGILLENDTDFDTETDTQAPETEIPTIEIPTQGPGLEYVPPQDIEQNPNTDGCQSLLFLPLCMLLPLAAVVLIKTKNRKGDLP